MQKLIEDLVADVMKRMKVWQKLGFLGLVFMFPLAAMSYKMISSIRSMGIELAERETSGVHYLGPVWQLLEDLQQYRDLASGLLSGEVSFAEKLSNKKAKINATLQVIDMRERQSGVLLQTTARWEALRKRITALMEQTPENKFQENFDQHTE